MICGVVLLATAALCAGMLRAADAAPQTGAYPRRIVSLNLCADQLVLALADRDQIAGLTHYANDPQMSAAAGQTRGLRILRGSSAEEVLGIAPDLVIGMPARRSAATGVLKAQSYRAVDLKPADSFAQIVTSVRSVAAAVGHPARGEALIARMERDLAALPRGNGTKVAAYYQRRGYMTGSGTLIDDLMTRIGMVNLATRLGKPALSHMSLEEMVAARPDFLVVESATDRAIDQGTEMLHHPALHGIPRISMPQAWTVCGGPAYVQAARTLSAAVGAH